MHTRHTSRNQQCRNTYTSAQDQLCNSVVQYAEHCLPTFKCCIFSTTHPDVFIEMTRREMSVELNRFACLFVFSMLMQCSGWNAYACCPIHPANNCCHRDGLSLWRKTLSLFIWKLSFWLTYYTTYPQPHPHTSSSTYIFILIFPSRLKMHVSLSTHLPVCIPTDLTENESYTYPSKCFTSG